MNYEDLDLYLCPYLPLFMSLLLESPVQRNCLITSYEEVVSALEKDTISSGSGLYSKFVAIVSAQIESKKYETVVSWLIDLLHSSFFTEDRVRVVASKMLNRISGSKRNASFVLSNIIDHIFYTPESNVRVFTVLNQEKFLTTLIENLNDRDYSRTILNDIDTLRKFLTKRNNLSLHIATNIAEHTKNNENLSRFWKKICRDQDKNFSNALRLTPDWTMMDYKGLGLSDGINGTVVGMGSLETACLYHGVQCINDFNSTDIPALRLYLQYFSQLEGPLWKQIRGQGFAHFYRLAPEINEGLLVFRLIRATNVVAAFKEAKNIIETHLKDFIWDEILLEGARSSLIFQIIEEEASVSQIVDCGLSFSYMQVPANYHQTLVKQVNKVTRAQLKDVGKKYVSQLFSAEAKTAIVCNPDKVKEVKDGFASMNITLSGAPSLEESILND